MKGHESVRDAEQIMEACDRVLDRLQGLYGERVQKIQGEVEGIKQRALWINNREIGRLRRERRAQGGSAAQEG